MNKFNKILGKYTYLLWIFLVGVLVSSCSSYKGTTDVEDGIYSQTKKEVIVVKEQTAKKDNFFARELEKYENLEESDEIILDAEEYSYDEENDYEEKEESNAAWGYDTKEVVVTHHISYNWYHPYHSSYYYGYNWGFYNWYYPSYYYRPWGYYNYAYHGYGGYYDPYFYGSYYRPYYGGYGYYNPNYYGGYGYNTYDHNTTRPYNQYGRRADYGNRFDNRRSLSRSVADNNNREAKPSLIRGSGTISERINRRTTADERTPTFDTTNRVGAQRGTQNRDNTSRTTSPTTRDNSARRTTTPRVNEGSQRTNPNVGDRTNTSRKTTPTRTRATTPTRTNTTKPSSKSPSRTKSKSSQKKSTYRSSSNSNSSSGSYSSGSSGSRSSSSAGSRSSSSSGSRGSSSSSGSSRGGRR